MTIKIVIYKGKSMGLLVAEIYLSWWKESLLLLRPKSLKLLIVASFNAVGQACSVLFRGDFSLFHRAMLGGLLGALFYIYCSLIVPYIIVPFAVVYVEALSPYCGGMDVVAKYSALVYIVFYIWCYLVHPSVHRKSLADFFSLNNFLVYVVSSVLFYSIIMPYVCYIGSTMFFPTPGYASTSSGLGNVLWLLVLFFVPILCLMWPALTVFFSLDSDGTLKNSVRSVMRSAKMICYNFPGFIVIMSAMLILGLVFTFLCGGIVGWLARLFLLRPLLHDSANFVAVHDVILKGALFGISVGFVIPFVVAVISNLYIKQLYDHKDRYI